MTSQYIFYVFFIRLFVCDIVDNFNGMHCIYSTAQM